MEAFFFYLLKTVGLLLLFLGCYHLLLRKETLFHFNRVYLLTGLILSFVLPLIEITRTIPLAVVPMDSNPGVISDAIGNSESARTRLFQIALALYLGGVLVSISKLLGQGLQLRHIINKGHRIKHRRVSHLLTTSQIHPFSFFSTIVYNPERHSDTELRAIVAHEEVHALQLHSLDIILMELAVALQWCNPMIRLYRLALKQNLEFIADTNNHHVKNHRKEYQYILLQQAVGKQRLSIVNPFFNSLIKKRIVMINKKPSSRTKAVKGLIMLPLIALFLVSFNLKREYTFAATGKQGIATSTIELIISKNTTDEELLRIKEQLADEQFDFSYTTVRNNLGEIRDLSLEISGGNPALGEVSSRYTSASDNDTIAATFIVIDTDTNSISIGQQEGLKSADASSTLGTEKDTGKGAKDIRIKTIKTTKKIRQNDENGNDDKRSEIDTNVGNGTTIVIEKKQMEQKEVVGARTNANHKKQVSINTSSSENYDIEIMEEQGSSFITVSTEGKGEPLYFVDGEKMDSKSVHEIDPSTIKSINVLKGDTALKKYGKKAKHGVVEITTKK